jgi:hypothetical protein
VLDAGHGGGVQCWGRNTYGQLGDGTNANSTNPVSVSGLSGMAGVAAGGYHACAVTTGGAVKCWGYNALGQLGDGTNADSTTPVDVSGLTGVARVVAGGSDTCAVTTGGAVKCWGDNAFGQLGDGTLDAHATPAGVTGFDGSEGQRAGTLATSGYHTCAVTTGGGVRCWGRNSEGQLGNNTFTNHLTPTDVWELGHGMTVVAAGGNHSCAVMDADHSGVSHCWGHNAAGQLGINPGWTPVEVVGFKRILVYQLGISPAETGVLLTWQHGDPANTGVTSYEAYRGAEPYGTPSTPEVPGPAFPVSGTTASYPDGAAFEPPAPSVPHFYVVQAVISADLKYPESNRVGTFSFVLIPGAP